MKEVFFASFVCLCFTTKAQMIPIRGEHLQISPTEVTNFEYIEFLNYHKNNKVVYQSLLPDTLVWRSNGYHEPYVEYYFRHPAYKDYPVVGVSYEQANDYCKWISKVYNKSLKTSNCKNCMYDSIQFRLPTEKEWEYAAKGGNPNAVLPWKEDGFRNQSKKYKGNMLANFVRAAGDHIINEKADVTAPVFSYWPNEYGLYNMAGNVAEMVSEKGISKGGSWKNKAHELKISHKTRYKKADDHTGFRIVMEVHKLKENVKKENIVLDKKFFDKYLLRLDDTTYFGKYEVSNQLYNIFVSETGIQNKPNHKLWRSTFEYGYFWEGNYHSHSKYNNHPVVNISKSQAKKFCDWLTTKYNHLDKKTFKKVQFKLPTQSEWEIAARGGLTVSPYPWGGPYLRNAKGDYLANFNPKWSEEENLYHYDTLSKEEFFNIAFDEVHDDDGEAVLAPVKSYISNDYGGYCFAGNASEMLHDKNYTKGGSWGSKSFYLLTSIQFKNDFEPTPWEKHDGQPSPFVGFRVFMDIIDQ